MKIWNIILLRKNVHYLSIIDFLKLICLIMTGKLNL